MATNVLVIPEDFTYDQYVLKPIVESLFAALGPKATVRVCQNPRLGGVGEALKWHRINEILDRYKGMVDLFLLIVDRDCDTNRKAKLEGLEKEATAALTGHSAVFLAEEAHQEIEVWLLAGLNPLPEKWSWKTIRSECHPKETYYDKVAAARGLLRAPHGGRQKLAEEAAQKYTRIRKLCPEVELLETRIRQALGITP